MMTIRVPGHRRRSPPHPRFRRRSEDAPGCWWLDRKLGGLGGADRAADPAGWRCIAYDHRGAGESPCDPASITVSAMVSDVVAVVDAVGVDRCILAYSGPGSPDRSSLPDALAGGE